MEKFDPFTIAVTGELFFILFFASIITYPLSLLLLYRYRAAVSKSMSKSIYQDAATKNTGGIQYVADTIKKPAPENTLLNNTTGADFFTKLYNRPWLAGMIHFIAGGVYAVLMTSVYLMATGVGFNPMRFLIFFIDYLWPAVIIVSIVAASTRQHNFLLFGAYTLCFFITGTIAIERNPTSSWTQFLYVWCTTNLLATTFVLFFLLSKVRAVAPMVFAFLSVAMIGVIGLPLFIGGNSTLLKLTAKIFFLLSYNTTAYLITLCVIGLILFSILGWLTLNIIKRRYDNKKISDQSITIDSILIVFGIIYSADMVFNGAYWVFIGLSVTRIYMAVVNFANKRISQRSGFRESADLLLLRVFSLGKRSKDLFSKVSKHWRYFGSIYLISGPDLSTSTIEPHEFLDYLTHKLSRRFISGADQLSIRLSEIDNKPDKDKRYRVNDFFCYEDTWKMVLSSLVSRSKIVLMDVRNFCLENKGCAFEINELINMISVRKVIFITDKTTDRELLTSTFQHSFLDMSDTSPNKHNNYEDVVVFNFDNKVGGTFKNLLLMLSETIQDIPHEDT